MAASNSADVSPASAWEIRLRPIFVFAPPFIAFALQLMLHDFTYPHIWFLFYPAIFISSYMGSLRSTVVAAVVTSLIVSWWLVPPAFSFEFTSQQLFPPAVFLATGVGFAVFSDRLRKATAGLRKALEERQIFLALVENSPDFIGIADAHGKPVYVNPAGRRMVGLAADYPVGKTRIPEYYTPDQRAIATDVIHKSMLEHGLWQGETAFRNWQTEASIPVSHAHFRIRDPGTGRILGMATITRDITDLKKAREDVRRAELISSGIISISADAIISVDENQRITLFNDGAERIFGYTKAEALGTEFNMLIPERLRAIHGQHLAKFAAGSDTARKMGKREMPIFGRRKNGEEFPADAAISKIDVDKKRILTVSLRDITAQKRLENDLKQAIQMRDDILGIVAHDLRSPLWVILMQASLLRRCEPASEAILRSAPEAIERAANRMNRLIQDLLDVTRMEAGRLSVEMVRVPVAPLLADVLECQKTLAAPKQITLQLDAPPDLPDIWADRDRLLQVFENLCGNALKFTPAGGRVTVGAKAQEREMLFWVADSGPGVPAENLPHLFERFWQARKADRQGAGLGLPIAKGIVEAHCGSIWVESTPGTGTTFFFTIHIPPATVNP